MIQGRGSLVTVRPVIILKLVGRSESRTLVEDVPDSDAAAAFPYSFDHNKA